MNDVERQGDQQSWEAYTRSVVLQPSGPVRTNSPAFVACEFHTISTSSKRAQQTLIMEEHFPYVFIVNLRIQSHMRKKVNKEEKKFRLIVYTPGIEPERSTESSS